MKDPFDEAEESSPIFDRIFQRIVNIVSLIAGGMVLVDAFGILEII